MFWIEIVNHNKVDHLLVGDTGKLHTNKGAGGLIRLWLPENAPVGIAYKFTIVNQFELRIDPQSKTLFVDSTAIANRYYSATGIGSTLNICSNEDGDWILMSKSGTWTRQT